MGATSLLVSEFVEAESTDSASVDVWKPSLEGCRQLSRATNVDPEWDTTTMLPIPVLCITEHGMILQANAIAHDFFQKAVLRGTKLQELVPPNKGGSTGRRKILMDLYLRSVCVAHIGAETDEAAVTVTLLRAPYGYRAIITDITSSLQSQSKTMAASAVQSVLQDRAEFITLLGHEVRTPLNAITMGISLIEDRKIAELCPDPEQRAILSSLDDHCADLQRYCGSLLHLVAEVVDMERLRGGLHSFKYSPLDLRAIVFSAKQAAILAHCSCSPQKKKKDWKEKRGSSNSPPYKPSCININIAEHFAPQVAMYSVWGDGPLLRQMLTHLYTNALQHTTNVGKVDMSVEWDWCREGASVWLDTGFERDQYTAPTISKKVMVTLRVWNSGSHIPDYVAANLFQPFHRRTSSRSASDRKGIGLSVCQQIVQTAHGGSISGYSDDTGTTFTIHLPLYALSQTLRPPEDLYVEEKLMVFPPRLMTEPEECCMMEGKDLAPECLELESASNAGGTDREETVIEGLKDLYSHLSPQAVDVLYVEDMRSNRKMLLRSMRASNIKAAWVENGKQAIDWFSRGNSCRVVLMDHRMPIMDGAEATKILRHRYPDVAIVGLTGETDDVEFKRFKKSGLDLLLQKPVIARDVVSVVTKYLDGVSLVRKRVQGPKSKEGESETGGNNSGGGGGAALGEDSSKGANPSALQWWLKNQLKLETMVPELGNTSVKQTKETVVEEEDQRMEGIVVEEAC